MGMPYDLPVFCLNFLLNINSEDQVSVYTDFRLYIDTLEEKN